MYRDISASSSSTSTSENMAPPSPSNSGPAGSHGGWMLGFLELSRGSPDIAFVGGGGGAARFESCVVVMTDITTYLCLCTMLLCVSL